MGKHCGRTFGVARVLSLPTVSEVAAAVLKQGGLATRMNGARRAKTCCLFYRVPGGLCGDCVFEAPPRYFGGHT